MSLTFTCPHCQAQITAPDTAAGQQEPCPHCQGAVQAPSPGAPGPDVIAASPATSPVKACPQCGKKILAAAVFCKHCRTNLSTPSPTAAVAEPALRAEPTTVATCPQCRISTEVSAALAGKAIVCGHCKATFKVLPPSPPTKVSLLKRPWARIAVAIIGVLMFVTITCKNCSSAKDTQMLADINGVWKCANDDTLITFDLTGDKKTVTIGTDVYPVTITDIDRSEDRLTVDAGQNGQEKLWTIRQDWDRARKSFTIHLTLQEGTSVDLEFVRNL